MPTPENPIPEPETPSKKRRIKGIELIACVVVAIAVVIFVGMNAQYIVWAHH
jgi:hypothetical protein